MRFSYEMAWKYGKFSYLCSSKNRKGHYGNADYDYMFSYVKVNDMPIFSKPKNKNVRYI